MQNLAPADRGPRYCLNPHTNYVILSPIKERRIFGTLTCHAKWPPGSVNVFRHLCDISTAFVRLEPERNFLEAPALLITQLLCEGSARSSLLVRVGFPKGFADLCGFCRSALTKGCIMVMYGEGSV